MRPPAPTEAVPPARIAQPAQPIAPPRAAVPAPPRAPAPALAYDPEDIEPERLQFEDKSADELLGGKAAAGGSAARPKRAAPLSGPNSGLRAYLATLPDEGAPLPSGVEELRGYSTQYKIPGMESMSMKEYRAVSAAARARGPSTRRRALARSPALRCRPSRTPRPRLRQAMDAKISRTVKEWRASRPVYGAAASHNYMDSLGAGRAAQAEEEGEGDASA